MKPKEWTRLQAIRLRKPGATHQALAAKMTYHYSYIGRVERGKIQQPAHEYFVQLRAALAAFGIRVTVKDLEQALADTLRETASKPAKKAA